MHYEKFSDGTVKCIEDEIPFELPEGWEWCNLGLITDVFGRIGFRGYTKNDLVAKGKGAITLSPSNIIDNKMDYSSCTYISWAKYEESPEIMIHNNDILLVKTGSSYGKSAFVEDLPEKATINPQFVVLKETRINPQFLCYFLQSNYAKVNFDKLVVGTAIPTFSQANLNAMYIAFPGINEQKRIVNKILELLKYIDTINDEKKCLQSVILQTKSKILDLAIHGKLVPQDPNDEPASVLLERIRAEKEELIKQGKIKRNKKESVIFKGDDNSYYEKIGNKTENIDDQIPFDLPQGWIWCRGYSCFDGMESTKPHGDFFDYIDIDAIDNQNHCIKEAKHLPVTKAPSRASRAVKNGSVLFSLVRTYLENIALVDEKYCNCIASTGFYVCNSNGMLLPEFMYFLMISGYVVTGLNQFMKGDNSPSICKDDIENWLYPVPPIKEQEIVSLKLKSILSTLNLQYKCNK